MKSCSKGRATARWANWGSAGNVGKASFPNIACTVRAGRCSTLEDTLYVMSVARRNTFDLFDEEADLLSTSEAKAAQKKKRRKRKPSLEHSENQTSQVAAKGQPTGDDEKHEVGPDMGQDCQSRDLGSNLCVVKIWLAQSEHRLKPHLAIARLPEALLACSTHARTQTMGPVRQKPYQESRLVAILQASPARQNFLLQSLA